MKSVVARQFESQLVNKLQVAENTWTFYFDRKKLRNFDFFPGQYIRVILPPANRSTTEENREFTISSSPTEKDFFTITTKTGRSDFKNALFNIVPGKIVSFFGPMGGFYLRKEVETPRILLAGGIGITPFRSMLKFAVDTNIKIPLMLMASFSTQEEMLFYNELLSFENESRHIRIIYILSNFENAKDWKGEKGRISETLIRKYLVDTQSVEFMISGSPWVVDGIADMLKRMKVSEDNIKTDLFTGY